MENLPDHNLILIDWLTVTSHIDDPFDFMDMLGIDKQYWDDMDFGMNGYPRRYEFESIKILYGGREDMGVCLVMSGQACRDFETHGHGDWLRLISNFFGEGSLDPEGKKRYNVTRIDVAFDDHTGILDMDQIFQDVEDLNYVSRSQVDDRRDPRKDGISLGKSVYIGAKSSAVLIRIYDKAAERGYSESTHWIRVELSFRGDRAHQCADQIYHGVVVGDLFAGLLRNYLTFRKPSADSNKSRWPIADYWQQLIDGADRILLWETPGAEYNVFRLERFLVHQCGGALRCFTKIYSWDHLFKLIKEANLTYNKKYIKIEDDHKRRIQEHRRSHNETENS